MDSKNIILVSTFTAIIATALFAGAYINHKKKLSNDDESSYYL